MRTARPSPFSGRAAVAAFAVLAVSTVAAPAVAAEPARQRTVAVVIYDQVEILDFTGPTQVFAAAGDIVGDKVTAMRVFTVARSKAPVASHGVLKLLPDYSWDDAPLPDLVVIPGGNSQVLLDDPKAMAWIGRAAAHAEVAMSVCTGAFVLGKLGLLKGHSVTTWYGAIDRLRKAFPDLDVQNGRRFIDNGKIVTTAGVSAGIDGALHVVARLYGRAAADATARYLEYHWSPEAYLAEGYK